MECGLVRISPRQQGLWYTFIMKHIISSVLYLAILLGLSEFVFNPTNLYYELPWLDIPMHIMGGFGVASLAAAVLSYKQRAVTYKRLLLAFLIVGTFWEIYEYVNHVMNGADWSGVFDTVKDYIDGALGASLAYLFVRK